MRKMKGDSKVKWEDMTEEQKRVLIDRLKTAKGASRTGGDRAEKKLRFAIRKEKF